MSSANFTVEPASYRDPAGFVFTHEGKLYRQVNTGYRADFELLKSSGLYELLVQDKLLVPHIEIAENLTGSDQWYKTLQPHHLPFISYPYEWSFDMLKDAALLTLKLMRVSIEKGMILKDASAYNVQFVNGEPIFIDTLSFEEYDATKPWIAYRQFCEHFLAPLALMHYSGQPLSAILVAYPDGVPLDLAASLLPSKTRWNLHLHLHIHLNSRLAKRTKPTNNPVKAFSKQKLANILSSLQSAIGKLQLDYKGTWWNYYTEAEQRDNYLSQKKALIQQWIAGDKYKTAFDAGANNGVFSELLASAGISVISADSDHFAVNNLYKKTTQQELAIQPLIADLSNPSPAVGVNNMERKSLLGRLQVDLVLALAVIHHLCIGKNIPFDKTVDLFSAMGKYLIIEFVPRDDEKVQVMLSKKKDIYDWYTPETFERIFARKFKIIKKEVVKDSVRTLYLMEAL